MIVQIFVKVQIFDSFNTEEEDHTKKVFGSQVQTILNSGKVLESGVFADSCGGFFLLDVDSAEELTKLVGPSLLYKMHVEIHPIMPIEKFSDSLGKQLLD